ncbi:MAG: hypothetical protein NC407_15305 [Lachnoclostridium sp.]|nr:hypothetical protein [Lachnoclostridium sp.]
MERMSLYARYTGNIKSILFDGIQKGVFGTAKFDSYPELLLARVLERDEDVIYPIKADTGKFVF